MEHEPFNPKNERVLELQFSRISIPEFWSQIIRFIALIWFNSDKRYFFSKFCDFPIFETGNYRTNFENLNNFYVLIHVDHMYIIVLML